MFRRGTCLFVVPQPRAGQSPTGGVFEPVRSAPIRDGPKRGKIAPTRRTSQTFPRLSMPKRGTCSHPTFDLSFTRYTHAKKKKTLDGWEVQGARQTLQIFIWSRFDGEHGHRRRRKAVSPFLSFFWGGVPLFVKYISIFLWRRGRSTLL